MLRLFLGLSARFAHRRGRLMLSAAGIALGVALGYGVQLVNRAAADDLAAAVRIIAGDADLEVRGGRGGFPEDLYPRLAALPAVALASPVLEVDAGVARSERPVRLVGLDVLRASVLQPQLFAEDPALRLELLKPDRVLVSEAAAQQFGLKPGGKLALVVGLGTVELQVAGVLPGLHGTTALADVATVQWRMGRLGELNRIDLRLSENSNLNEVQSDIAALLPPGTHVSAVSAVEEAAGFPSRAYRVNLNVLALAALFTGAFLVFSAQALETARRRGEHALLRALGLERRGIARLVLGEAALLGVAGGVAGLAIGYGLAFYALRWFGADLGSGQLRAAPAAPGFSPLAALAFLAGGVGIALAGSLWPAIDASRTPPARALKAGDEQRVLTALPSAWPGIALLAFAAVLALLPALRGLPAFGYAAIACLLLGTVALMPRVSQLAFLRLPAAGPAWFALAVAQLRGAPGQAAVSLAAIVASFSLVAAMLIMVASFRQSVDDWLAEVLPADLYFRTTHAGETGFLPPGFEERVRALPQVARAEFLRARRVSLRDGLPQVSLIARDGLQPADPPQVRLSEAAADLYGLRAGMTVELPIAGATHKFLVAAVQRDYARQHGAIFMDRQTYVRLTADRRLNDGALWLKPGTSAADAAAALRALPGGEALDMAEPGEIRELSLRIFDRSFAASHALEAVAVLVGLFGLSSSLGAIVLARRREFGVLRHLGLTRRGIAAMLAAEGGLLAGLGAAAGLAAGAAMSLVLIYVVNRQSFHWSMDVHPPYALLALLSFILIVLSSLTAIVAGREAMSLSAVRAVKEDW